MNTAFLTEVLAWANTVAPVKVLKGSQHKFTAVELPLMSYSEQSAILNIYILEIMGNHTLLGEDETLALVTPVLVEIVAYLRSQSAVSLPLMQVTCAKAMEYYLDPCLKLFPYAIILLKGTLGEEGSQPKHFSYVIEVPNDK